MLNNAVKAPPASRERPGGPMQCEGPAHGEWDGAFTITARGQSRVPQACTTLGAAMIVVESAVKALSSA
jgi:hypothetical protein